MSTGRPPANAFNASQPILLTGGQLVDGTGSAATAGDLLLRGGKIAAIGRFTAPQDAKTFDCTGRVVCPAFIDAHSHSDLQVLEDRTEKIAQGVTAEVVGNCGFSPYPAHQHQDEIRQFANGIFCGGIKPWGWPDAQTYLEEVERRANVSVASLLGHGTLRIAFAGNKVGPLEEKELSAMESFLDQALQAGATGFSTGLMYAPGSSAPFEELERLCRVVARNGKIYCSHIRDYSFHLEEAVDEQLELGRRTGCKLQISHLQTVGQMNWPKQCRVIEKIEQARRQGVDVEFDCYPYVAGSTVLTQLLPQWALNGGISGLLGRLKNPEERSKIAEETLASIPHRWSDVLISAVSTEANQRLVGLDLASIGALRGVTPIEAMLQLLAEESGEANMISFNQSEENLHETITHPLSTIISDGFYVKGRPHPRLHGTFPRLLGAITRDRKWLTLEEAIHKVTGKPAERFGFAKRGLLREGYEADAVVFDPATVDSPASFDCPELPPIGIYSVFHAGAQVWPR